MSNHDVEIDGVRYARVGWRLHLVFGGAAYVGQPEVGLCRAVFIRATEQRPEDLPLCCHVMEVERLRHEANDSLDRANEIALSMSSPPTTSPGQPEER